MNIKELLGKKIKKLRKKRKLTQEQLAEMIEITPRNISRIEVGESFVTAETLDKITKALNVPAEVLFSYEHLKDEDTIIEEIYKYIEKIKSDRTQLEKLYKFIQIIVNDEF